MKKTTVTKSALREMINEIFDDKDYGVPYSPAFEKTPAVVDDIVDPSQALTDPGDENFNPQDNRELSLAINQIVKIVPDESIGPFYKRVKQVADDMLCGRDDLDNKRPPQKMPVEDEMKNEQKRVEETIRKAVRKILIEMNQDSSNNDEELGPTGSGTTVPAGDASTEKKTRLKHGQKSSSSYDKKELVPFKDVAASMTDYLGTKTPVSVAGAKQMVDKAWRKSRFIDHHYPTPEKKQVFMNDMVNRYITMLNDTNEITSDDLAVLQSHPDMVVELPGFEDYMREELEDMGYYSDIEFTDAGAPIPRDPNYQFDDAGRLKK